jgi:hypothetical protein
MRLNSNALRRLSYRSPLAYYLYERMNYDHRLLARPDEPNHDLINRAVRELRAKGTAILPGFYDPTYADQLQSKLLELNKEVTAGQIPPNSNLYCEDISFSDALFPKGIVRVHNVDQWSGLVKRFADEPLFMRIGELVCGTPLLRKTTISQYNERGGSADWHMDYYANPFKAFLYVTDVATENGPLITLPGSHALNRSNMRRIYLHLDGREVTQTEVIRSGYLPTTHPVPKGSVILLDTRLIHQGGHVLSGFRIVLANYYWENRAGA